MADVGFRLAPVNVSVVLKDRVYDALKQAIMDTDVYREAESPRLDERRLAEQLGVSRTPVREALQRLEQEGLVETVPRKGAYIVRKTKREILEMINVWAALESMAARLATQRASDAELAQLRSMFATFSGPQAVRAGIDEYSETNIRFHQNVVRLSHSALLMQMAQGLFNHMHSIRARTIGDEDRAGRSIIDHMHIIEAIEARNTELAERLVMEHTLNLGEHVAKHVDFLD